MRSLIALALLLFAGCQMMMHRTLDNKGRDEVVRVESGDRLFLHLSREEGSQWTAKSDDSDVEVEIDQTGDDARVKITVHRGYDGPSLIDFTYSKARSRKVLKTFRLSLYRKTGDTAFWK